MMAFCMRLQRHLPHVPPPPSAVCIQLAVSGLLLLLSLCTSLHQSLPGPDAWMDTSIGFLSRVPSDPVPGLFQEH